MTAEELYRRLKRDGEAAGYHLNPDEEFTLELIRGLLVNEERYGYQSCPCRIAAGNPEADRDIVCPCVYRDPDLNEYDQCYCALYVSGDKATGEKPAGPIPERRGKQKEVKSVTASSEGGNSGPPLPVWRCTVCGYLAGREDPPGICPICKAKQDKFERFM